MPAGPPSRGRFGRGQLPASVSTRRFRAFARPDHDACTLPSSPPALPLDISAAFWYGVVGRGKPPCDGHGDDEVLGTRFQRARDDADPRGRAGLSGLEPDGAGAHGVRVVAVAAPERAAEGARVPRVPGAARRGRGAGAAGQGPGPRPRLSHPRPPDGGGRAGLPARRQRARRRAAGCRAGARSGGAAAVPGAGGPLPLPSGTTVPFGAHLRYLVFASRPQRVVVGCLQFSSPAWRMAARDRVGRVGRRDSGAESPARGQQQPLPAAAVGRGEEPRQRGALFAGSGI